MLISKNEIHHNEIGIFHVPSGQNTVDFDPAAYHGYRFGDGKVRLEMNNIEGNMRYNYMMGDRQSEDIQADRNWWGGGDSNEIEQGIYDGEDDASLGRVLYTPFLVGKNRDAGPDERRPE
ncbi:MAG: hypothetical protein D6726_04670 [Nitrospirae bacterium]|nr:MAG: hypothetical protein D6726_04670 [Nitrospirota bacterium]